MLRLWIRFTDWLYDRELRNAIKAILISYERSIIDNTNDKNSVED